MSAETKCIAEFASPRDRLLSAPCRFGRHILEHWYVARGLRAGAQIAVPGGLRARKEPFMATDALTLPTEEQYDTALKELGASYDAVERIVMQLDKCADRTPDGPVADVADIGVLWSFTRGVGIMADQLKEREQELEQALIVFDGRWLDDRARMRREKGGGADG